MTNKSIEDLILEHGNRADAPQSQSDLNYLAKRLYDAYVRFTTPQSPVGGGGKFQHLKSDSIDGMLKTGAVLIDGKVQGNPDYSDRAALVKRAYETFKGSEVGKELESDLGGKDYHGYAMFDLGEGAIAATIQYNDGTTILAWNSRYQHVLENPQAHPETFLEAMVHEKRHASGDLSERSTYKYVGEFFGNLAEKVGGYLSDMYRQIAQSSYRKADIFGEPAMGY